MPSKLTIIKRDVAGKSEMRKLRHDGFVPGIIYGDTKEPILISVGEKELMNECYTLAFLGHVIDAEIGKTKEKILPKEIVFHPVTGRPLHVDFQRISKNSKVRIGIAIEFINEDKSPGMKKGGVINVVIHKLDCLCSPDSIPEKISIDLSDKEIGASIMLEDLDLGEGIIPANKERDTVIATIVGSRASISADASGSDATAA